ncbi:MAG: hypothetical protein OXI58_08455 [Gemmatimonadota bacterium]|nr:hypothetical protein [Gemmatimonadota bacterium]
MTEYLTSYLKTTCQMSQTKTTTEYLTSYLKTTCQMSQTKTTTEYLTSYLKTTCQMSQTKTTTVQSPHLHTEYLHLLAQSIFLRRDDHLQELI